MPTNNAITWSWITSASPSQCSTHTHIHKHSTLHPTNHPSTECMPNINDVIWFDVVTISGCLRHQWNHNNIRKSTQRHILSFIVVRLYWFCLSTNERFSSSSSSVCTQNEMRQKAIHSLYSVCSVQWDTHTCMCVHFESIAQIERACCFFLVSSHRRRRCGVLNWVFRVQKSRPYKSGKRICVCDCVWWVYELYQTISVEFVSKALSLSLVQSDG